jgi:hypothetical protein
MRCFTFAITQHKSTSMKNPLSKKITGISILILLATSCIKKEAPKPIEDPNALNPIVEAHNKAYVTATNEISGFTSIHRHDLLYRGFFGGELLGKAFTVDETKNTIYYTYSITNPPTSQYYEKAAAVIGSTNAPLTASLANVQYVSGVETYFNYTPKRNKVIRWHRSGSDNWMNIYEDFNPGNIVYVQQGDFRMCYYDVPFSTTLQTVLQGGLNFPTYSNLNNYPAPAHTFYEPNNATILFGRFFTFQDNIAKMYSVNLGVTNDSATLVSTINLNTTITNSIFSPGQATQEKKGFFAHYNKAGTKLAFGFIDIDFKVYTFLLDKTTFTFTKVLDGVNISNKIPTNGTKLSTHNDAASTFDLDNNGHLYFVGKGSTENFRDIYKLAPTGIETIGKPDNFNIANGTISVAIDNIKVMDNQLYISIALSKLIAAWADDAKDVTKQITNQLVFLKAN